MHGTWLSELWRYRELVYFLAWRDVKVRYKQAALGAAWAVLQPLLTMVVFTILFGRLAGMPSDGIPYPLFCFCALVLWIYFSGVLTQAGQSLQTNANLVTKVYFPRIVLPVSTAVAGLIDFAVGLACLAGLMIYYGARPGWSLLLAPVFILGLVMLALGLGFFLAAVNARYRDVKSAMPFVIQLGLFVTPIIFPTTLVPERLKPLVALNPLAGIVEGFRASLFPGRPLDWTLTAVSLTVTAVVFVLGALYFRKA